MDWRHLSKDLGTLSIDPSGDVVAGSYGTWRLVYTAGRFGMDDDATLKVCWRFASDWGQPQAKDPRGENYFTCTTTGPATVEAGYQFKGHVRPWFHGILVRVFDGDLSPGDQIILTLGERSGGSPGQRAPTAISRRSEFRAWVDCCGTRQYLPLAHAATLSIISSPATKLVLTAPRQAVVGEPFRVHVRLEDEWGNPASGYRATVSVTGTSPSSSIGSLGEKEGGVAWLDDVTLDKPGTYWLQAREDRLGLTARSNPIVCQAAPSALKPFWGDLHGQSQEAMGLGSVSDYFRFGRDVIALDFGSNQGNDFDIDAEGWGKIRAAVRELNEPGRFVTFLGYEWSGNVVGGGDHNVLYRGDDGPLFHSGHWCVEADGTAPLGKDEGNDRYPVDALYRAYAGRDDVLLVPHVGGRHGNFAYHDPRLERLVEIYSSWGLFEWFLEDALRHGMKVGFVGASDDHKGRPGTSPPGAGVFGVRGGLTCVLASEKKREALWDALRARRCYATSGARIVMEFDADGHPMGAEFSSANPRIRCRVIGTAPLERLELRRNTQVIHVVEPPTLTAPGSRFIRLAWSGLRNKARYARQVWDGHIEMRNGRILSAKGWAFDTTLERILSWDEKRVEWRSATAGDSDGVLLEVEETPETTLAFRAAPRAFDLRLRDLAQKPMVYLAGGLNLAVEVRRWPGESALPMELSLDFTDAIETRPRHRDGFLAYYVKAVQSDGNVAYTSPAYVVR